MRIQKTAWGQVEWLTSDDASPISEVMSVGIATIRPHVRQESHIHYEAEQFIYILQGAGYEFINGKRQSFQKGMFPFNFLQPIVENAFTHGFVDFAGQKRLEIRVRAEDGRLCFLVANNGTAIDEITLNRIQNSMDRNSGHGMSLVCAKLEATYGDDFSITIHSAETQGTEIRLEIPCRIQSNGGDV